MPARSAGIFRLRYTNPMTWARRRQLIIGGIVLFLLLLAGLAIWFFLIRTPATCSDGKQNQNEQGIDCGGSCALLCVAALSNPEPNIKFVRTVSPSPGRIDVIAYIDNPNATAAAPDVPYTLEVYDAQNILLARREGVVDLPAGVTTPLFIPRVLLGYEGATHAFITIEREDLRWVTGTSPERNIAIENVLIDAGPAPRVSATLRNTSVVSLPPTSLVATLFDESGNAVAASATVVEAVPGKGERELIFTWPSAFSATVSRVEILQLFPFISP